MTAYNLKLNHYFLPYAKTLLPTLRSMTALTLSSNTVSYLTFKHCFLLYVRIMLFSYTQWLLPSLRPITASLYTLNNCCQKSVSTYWGTTHTSTFRNDKVTVILPSINISNKCDTHVFKSNRETYLLSFKYSLIVGYSSSRV